MKIIKIEAGKVYDAPNEPVLYYGIGVDLLRLDSEAFPLRSNYLTFNIKKASKLHWEYYIPSNFAAYYLEGYRAGYHEDY